MRHVSVSQISMFARCQEQWRRRYIEYDKVPPGIAAIVGKGVHFAAEVNYRQKIESAVDLPMSDMADAAASKYDASLSEGVFIPREARASADIDLDRGKDRAVALAKAFAVKIAPSVQPLCVEQQIELDVEGIPYPYVGVIDCLTKDICLSDLKTASKKWNQARADHELQPCLYPELVRKLIGQYPKNITFNVLVTRKGKNRKAIYQSFSTTRNREDFEMLVRRTQIMLAQIKTGIFHPAQPGAWNCSPRWCGYWWTCPNIPPHKKILPPAGV